MATAAKEQMAEAEKRMGKPVKMKARAKERAARAVPMIDLCRGPDCVTPFPSARTRVALHAVKPRTTRELKGPR